MTMNRITDKKRIRAFAFLFTITYMASYMTRINFGAVISEIVEQTGMTKQMLSAAVTGSAITYGVGQIISGRVGDKVSPKKLVFYGLMVSSGVNLLLPFCASHYQMAAVWCVNGLAQAFMWPPMVKLMVGIFEADDYKRASTMVNWGSSFGTIAIYLGAPVVIALSSWKVVFGITAFIGIGMALLWMKFCVDPTFERGNKAEESAEGTNADTETTSGGSKVVSKRTTSLMSVPLMPVIMFAIVLQGALRDGVTTWMPSYISETYNLRSEISILSGVLLPIFSVFCLQIALMLYGKMPGNPIGCAGMMFAVGTCSALALTVVSGNSVVGSVIFSALLAGCMYGVNLMLISMVPSFFRRFGNVATVSGVLNSCTYVGSAISTYGIALVSESAGWKVTAFIWFVIAALGTAVCVAYSRLWNKHM